jgi:hypothetical protein
VSHIPGHEDKGNIRGFLEGLIGGRRFVDREQDLQDEERREFERNKQRQEDILRQILPFLGEQLTGIEPEVEASPGFGEVPVPTVESVTAPQDTDAFSNILSAIAPNLSPELAAKARSGAGTLSESITRREAQDRAARISEGVEAGTADLLAELGPERAGARKTLFDRKTQQGIEREQQTFEALTEQRQDAANERFREFVRQTDYTESVRQAAEAGEVKNLAGIADLFGVQAFVELADDAEAGAITDPLTFLGDIVNNMSEVTGLPTTDPKQLDAAEDALHRYHPFFNDVKKIASLIQSNTSLQIMLGNRGVGFDPFNLSDSTSSAIEEELRRRGAQ